MRRYFRQAVWVVALGVASTGLGPNNRARADRIVLKGGTELRGVVVPDPKQPESVFVLLPSSTKPLELPREKVVRVVREPSALDTYLERRKSLDADMASTGKAHYELGVWCEHEKLFGPALIEFQRAVALDPTIAEAQKRLGKTEYGGRWLTFDELRSIQGLVHYKGQWITPERKAELESGTAEDAGTASWTRRIAVMRQKIAGGNAEERLQALEQLDAIRDPGAIKPLLRAFGQDGPEWRSRLGRTIAGIPGTLATAALVDLVLGESDLDVRQGTLDALSQRREPDTSSRFGAALRSKDPIIHGRAAWALAALDEQAIVPKLVPLLVHSQRRVVMVPSAGGGGNMSATFSSGGGIPAPGGLGGFGVYSAVPILTGPAMAPGAVAFGATSVPFATDYAGFSSGGVAGGPSNVPRWRLIWNNQPNQDVHDALVKLTGIDLGFDENAWGQWVRTQFRPRESSTRRVGTP